MKIEFFASILAFITGIFRRKKNSAGKPYPNFVKRENRFTPKVYTFCATKKGYHKGCFGKSI